jgi:PmbA protein
MTIFDKAYYEGLSAEILAQAKAHGATSAEISISIESGFSVTSRLGQVETVEHHQDKGMGITVFVDKQTGSASSTDLSVSAIETAIEKACNIAKYTNADPCSGLADKKLLASDFPNLDLDHPWDITTEAALELAIACENMAMQDKRITNSEGVSITTHRALHVYANSNNFVASELATDHSLNCVLIAQENGHMHRDYDYTVARQASDLMPIEILAKNAVQKTTSRLGARRLKTRSAPVIFNATLARNLLNNFVSAISGTNIYRKSSFLVDQLHQQVMPDYITLTQYPYLAKGLGSASFDSEGVQTREQDYVQNGFLQSYLLNSYSARKLGMESTGNAGGVYNLAITHGDSSLEQLLKQMDTGLLVTELIGQGINMVTGDYSRGAFGYWVEKGEIQFPVEEITIAGNLRDMFRNIVAVGNDIDRRGKILTGSILLETMTIAGE